MSNFLTSSHLVAEDNYAPQPLHGSKLMPGCFMVVMDYIDGDATSRGQFSNDDLVRVRKVKDFCTNTGLSLEICAPTNLCG